MRHGLNVVLLAASLAGCAGTFEKEQPPAFGQSFTAEWRSKGEPAPVAAPAAARAGTEAERKELEDWRAFQEWKRNNPK